MIVHNKHNITFPKANIVDFDFDYGSNRILWLSWNEILFSTKLDGQSDQLLLWYDFYEYFFQFTRKKIAVDFVNEKLYLIDTYNMPTIEVLDFEGTHRSVICDFPAVNKSKDYAFSEIQKYYAPYDRSVGMLFIQEFPHEIVLDPYEGLMFILTNVNGTGRVSNSCFSTFLVDVTDT